MKLAKLTVSNFRCFGEAPDGKPGVIFLPNKGLNLIIGPNGSGKTALLDALDIVLNADRRYDRSLISEYDFPLCDLRKRIMIQATLTDFGTALAQFESEVQWINRETSEPIDDTGQEPDESKHQQAVVIGFEAANHPEFGEIKWRWIFPKFVGGPDDEPCEVRRSQHEALGYFRIRPALGKGAFSLGEYSELGRYLRRHFKLGPLSDRIAARFERAKCRLDGSECKTCPERPQCARSLEGSARAGMKSEEETLALCLQRIVREAKEALGVLAWEDLQPALGPRSAELRSQLSATTLGFGKDEDEHLRFLPFERLSGGEKYALSFALATSQVRGDLPIIVMEEPETALYPSAIARILTNVQQRGIDQMPQVIVSSHSEAVLRRFAIDNVSIMSGARKPENIMLAINSKMQGPDQQKARMAVETLLMPGEASALFAEKVAVVEGAHDAIVSGCLDRLAARLGSESAGAHQSFASVGWVVFSAHGASKALLRANLFKSLDKKIALVFDGDTEGRAQAEKAKASYPTFVFKACDEESEPEIEDALLLGLPAPRRESALTMFYGFAACQRCQFNTQAAKCWKKRNCSNGNTRPYHKRDLQEACLQAYEDGRLFPPAFSILLAKLDNCQPGEIIELPLVPEQNAAP